MSKCSLPRTDIGAQLFQLICQPNFIIAPPGTNIPKYLHPVLHLEIVKHNQQVEKMKIWKLTGKKFQQGVTQDKQKEWGKVQHLLPTPTAWNDVHSGIFPMQSSVESQFCFASPYRGASPHFLISKKTKMTSEHKGIPYGVSQQWLIPLLHHAICQDNPLR